MKQNEDRELCVRCSCRDAFHLFYIYYSPDREYGYAIFEPEFRVFHGSLWTRIKKAVALVFDGWESSSAAFETMDVEAVKQIRDFCDEAIKDWPKQGGETR